MKVSTIAGILLASGLGASALAQPVRSLKADIRPQGPSFILTVLHHSDGESQLLGTGPNGDFGGIARFRTLADILKADAVTDPGDGIPRGVVMISSGDNFLAGPEFTISLRNGVPFFDSIGLDLIGYDALTIGNHEFDFGPDVLRDFILGFAGPITMTSANLDFTGEPDLQALVDDGRIAPRRVFDVNGVTVAVIGLTTTDLPFISSPRNVVVLDDLVGILNAQVALAQGEGAEIIILSSHLQSIQNEIDLAAQIDGVDIIIAGGGGELLANNDDLLIPGDSPDGPYPIVVQDLDGTDVPIVSTSGDYAYIGRLEVAFDALGNLVEVRDASGAVRVSGVDGDAVDPDPTIQALIIDPLTDALADLASNVIAFSSVDLDGQRDSVRNVETNLGNAIADALLWQARELAQGFGAPLPDVAFQNGGGIRNDSIIPAGDITELDTFDILPFPNFVTVVEGIPASQLKELIENAVSRLPGNGRFAQVSGLTFTYDINGTAQVLDDAGNVITPGTRVRFATLNDGTPIVFDGEAIDLGRSFNVATIDFLARGGDQYPFRGATQTNLGVSYQQALFNYFVDQLQGLITTRDYPEGGEGRIND